MSYEDAKLLYQVSHESQQKFEYFLTGSIGAMFAYTVQTYEPQKLGFHPSTLVPLAIICFALSFFFGLLRLGYFPRILGIRSHQAAAVEDMKRIEAEFLKVESYRDQLSPEEESNAQSWESVLARRKARSDSAKPLLSQMDSKVRRYYAWRLRMMILGFSLIVVSRIMTPYFDTTEPQSQQTTDIAVKPQEVTTTDQVSLPLLKE